MAWIELHQNLPTHKKTNRLVRALGLEVPKDNPLVVGHLCVFWLWCIDGTNKGSLGDMGAQDVADAAGWTGDPETFMEAMIGAGFIDRCESGLRIHDWDDYIGKIVASREKERQRNRDKQARARERAKAKKAEEAQAVEEEPEKGIDFDPEWRKVVLCYEKNIGGIPNGIACEKLISYKDDLGADVVCKAIEITNTAQPSNPWTYLNKILSNWADKGINTVEAAEAYCKDLERKLEAKRRKDRGDQNDPPAVPGDFY